MTWLAHKLKNRIQIQTASQVPNAEGGADLTYATMTTIWAEKKTTSDYIRSIRGAAMQVKQGGAVGTHSFYVRKSAVASFGRQYSTAFADSFDNEGDINCVKSEHFVFEQLGSTSRGLRYRIIGIDVDTYDNEYVRLLVEEIEESGTGWPL